MATEIPLAGAAVAAHLSPLALFLQADSVVKAIMILLAVASVASWGVILDKLLKFGRLQKQARAWLAGAASEPSLRPLENELATHPDDPFARIHSAITAEWRESHRRGLTGNSHDKDSLKERLNRVGQIALGVEIERLQKGLQVLATIGSVAPFVGLFGTVWALSTPSRALPLPTTPAWRWWRPASPKRCLPPRWVWWLRSRPWWLQPCCGRSGQLCQPLGTLIGLTEVELSRRLSANEAPSVRVQQDQARRSEIGQLAAEAA